MKLFEMEGFLRGKCIPRDLKVNETNAEYLVRKFGELESKLETALRECRSAGITIDNLEAKCAALAVENAMLKQRTQQLIDIISNTDNDYCMCGSAMKDHVHSGCGYPTGMFDYYYNQWLESDNKTPATDAFLAEVRAQGVDSAINTVIAMMNHQHPVTSKAIDIMRVHAYQIRKGVQS